MERGLKSRELGGFSSICPSYACAYLWLTSSGQSHHLEQLDKDIELKSIGHLLQEFKFLGDLIFGAEHPRRTRRAQNQSLLTN